MRSIPAIAVFLAFWCVSCGGSTTPKDSRPPTDNERISSLFEPGADVGPFVDRLLSEYRSDSAAAEARLELFLAEVLRRQKTDPAAGELMNRVLVEIAKRPWHEQIFAFDHRAVRSARPVLKEGSVIVAVANDDTLVVEALPDFQRKIRWRNCERSIHMLPAAKNPIDTGTGTLDLHFSSAGEIWDPCDGISRAVVDEKHLRFDSETAALRWISELTGYENYHVEGEIVLAWSLQQARRRISIGIWHIAIANRPSHGLFGPARTLQ